MNCTVRHIQLGDVFEESNKYVYYAIASPRKGIFTLLYQRRLSGEWGYNAVWKQPTGYKAHVIGDNHNECGL